MQRVRPAAALAAAARRANLVNLATRRALARRAVAIVRRRHRRVVERPGVTVVTVTWNSLDYLRGCLAGVRKYTEQPIDILVIDNHSTDGTTEFLATQADARAVRLPLNVGHGLGLDLAFALAQTEFVVVLDVDAFPISNEWLATVLEPLEAGSVVAGAYVQRAFIHPSFLAMRRRDYLRLNLEFVPVGAPTAPGSIPRGLFMDVAEALCQTVAVVEGSAVLHRVPITADSGNHLVGSIYGGVVYHNFYSTQGKPELVAASKRAWSEAVARYL
jgi:hypothetical protein